MKLMIREPLEEIEQLQKSVDRMLNEFIGRRPVWTFPTMEWAPPVEVFETELEVVVKVALPNIDPKLLDIKVADDMIAIKGETKHDEEEKGRNYYQRELRYGRFLAHP
jgi:HSP20 family protein